MTMMMTIQMTLIKVMQRQKKLLHSKFPKISLMSKMNSLSVEKTIQISSKDNRNQTRKLKVIKLMVMTMMMKSTLRIKTRIQFLAKMTLNNNLHNSNKKTMKPRTKRRIMGNKTNSSSLKLRLGKSKCLILLRQSSI